jgi:integrase
VQALTEDVVRKILSGNKCLYKDLFLFLLFTGCRVGEAIALTWNEVDLKNGFIYFRNTDYQGQLQSAKNKRTRVIPMTRCVKELLQRHISLNKCERVFLNKNNKPCIYYTVRDAWTVYASKLQLRPCGLHALRHTFATLAIRAGANIKAVSQILGHSDVNITLNIYTDISPAQKRIALNTFENALDYSPEQIKIAM